MKAFLQKVVGYKQRFTPKLNCFKETILLGPKMKILVVGESNTGVTSVLLDLCREYILEGYTVIYYDCSNAITTKRVTDLKDDLFIVVRPNGSDSILTTVQIFSQHKEDSLLEKVVFVFDAAYVMSEQGFVVFKNNLEYLREFVEHNVPNATIIVSERRSKPLGLHFWSAALRLEYVRGLSEDRTQFAHLIEITGPKGKYLAYVDYRYGRLNRAFDFGYQLKLEGVKASGNFLYEGEIYKGLWNLSKDAEWFK